MRKVSTTSFVSGENGRWIGISGRRSANSCARKSKALVGRHLGIPVADARVAEDLVQGAAVAVGVLPDIERHQVQPEDLDLPHEIADQAGPGVRHAGTAQVVRDDLQVFF